MLSSVFETQIGVENALQLADQLPELNQAIGFDTFGAFADSLCALQPASVIRFDARRTFSPNTLWQ